MNFSTANFSTTRPQFCSTLGNDAELVDTTIAIATRAVVNGVRSVSDTVLRLERQPVTAADILLNRVVDTIDYAALERAQQGIKQLEDLLGPHGTVVIENADNSVISLREQVDAATASLAPYQALRRKRK